MTIDIISSKGSCSEIYYSVVLACGQFNWINEKFPTHCELIAFKESFLSFLYSSRKTTESTKSDP